MLQQLLFLGGEGLEPFESWRTRTRRCVEPTRTPHRSLYPTQCCPSLTACLPPCLPACLQDLMFLGDFEMAKMRAQQEAKWLMLNLQDSNEFDSHR